MEVTDAGAVVPPLVEIGMRERHRVDAVLRHQRVRLAAVAVEVKLPLEQYVDRAIDGERIAVRTLDAESLVEIEAAGAFAEQFEPAARELVTGW